MFLEGEEYIKFLDDNRNLYIYNDYNKNDVIKIKKNDGKIDFLSLYKIEEITFEDKAPRREALENVINSMNIKGVNFVYMIKGSKNGINFYYGVSKDYDYDDSFVISDIGENILKPSLQGNFRGSKIKEVKSEEKRTIIKALDRYSNVSIIEGVPGVNKDDDSFQSVDRLIDIMLGDEFVFIIIAKSLNLDQINDIKKRVYDVYNKILPIGRTSLQESNAYTISSAKSTTNGESSSKTDNSSSSKQVITSNGVTKSDSYNESVGDSNSEMNNKSISKMNKVKSETGEEGTSKQITKTTSSSKSRAENYSESNSETTINTESNNNTKSQNNSHTESKQKNENKTETKIYEKVNKNIEELKRYIDEILLPKIDYGLGKGIFITSMILYADNPASLVKLENTIKSIYGGEEGNRVPLNAFKLNDSRKNIFNNMIIPKNMLKRKVENIEYDSRIINFQYMLNNNEIYFGNWMSSKELSLLAGLPQKEVVGLSLREEVDFGLNIGESLNNDVKLGHLVQSGIDLNGKNGSPNREVNFNKDNFDRHIFVTGVTGSGKTTTCQKLLLESDRKFMVIEPAKTEYRALLTSFDDMLVFTLGKENENPFRLNPFEFFKNESITSRVDMIKASMESSFQMEAAIPQILETAIYSCYEEKGWNIATNENLKYKNPFDGDVQAFPTFSDLVHEVKKVVEKQGFDERLKNDYIGSIKARLNSLLVGAKGLMLDTPRSIDFVDLLDRNVVLELDSIKSSSEKSLIMGFILGNLNEAIKEKYMTEKEKVNHITLIEESHRLLSKFTPGDNLNKKQGVEMFSDMLAEIRKYGESLIIADQIPNKLTPEVLKNTNTKIVHKIFAQDDKETIGNIMALNKDQMEHLSYLDTGRAIMISPGMSKSIQIKIEQNEKNYTEKNLPEFIDLRKNILEYYSENYKKGILPGLEKLDRKPNIKIVKLYLEELNKKGSFIIEFINIIKKEYILPTPRFLNKLEELINLMGIDDAAKVICSICFYEKENIVENVKKLLSDILKENKEFSFRSKKYSNLLEDSTKL